MKLFTKREIETKLNNVLKHEYNDWYYGVRNAIVGVYDKWYRYNRINDGEEYNKGYKWAIDNVRDLPECITIINGQ